MSSAINFQLTFREAGTLKKIFETLSGLIKDCQVNISEQGLTIETIDNGRIALISLNLPASFFTDFRCEKPSSIGIRTSSFLKVLKFCGSDDTVTLSQRSSTSDSLDVLVDCRKFTQTMSFTIKLFKSDSDQLDIPRPEFESVVSMHSGRFATMIRDLSGIGKTCRISTSERDESISFEVAGDDTTCNLTLNSAGFTQAKDEDGRYNTESDGEEGGFGDIDIKVKGEVDKKYPINYLMLFSKAAALADKVKVELSNTAPMSISFKFNGDNGGRLGFLLAYKLDDDADADDAEAAPNDDDI